MSGRRRPERGLLSSPRHAKCPQPRLHDHRDRSADSDGVASKTPCLPGITLRHLLSRDRGARTCPQTRNDPERGGKPEGLHRDDSGETECRQLACDVCIQRWISMVMADDEDSDFVANAAEQKDRRSLFPWIWIFLTPEKRFRFHSECTHGSLLQ
jgi:hypothetical protein